MAGMKKRHDEFVDKVAHKVLDSLSEDDREFIYKYPDSTTHHFGLGLWIRNKYIYNKKLDFFYGFEDDLSSEIIERIASLIIDNYDYENSYYRRMYDDYHFGYYRRLYFARNEEWPDALMEEYAEMAVNIDEDTAVKQTLKDVKERVLGKKQFEENAEKYGLTDNQIKEFRGFVKNYNNSYQRGGMTPLPYDLALLGCKSLEPELRQQLLRILAIILEENTELASKMPRFVLNQEDASQVVARIIRRRR